MPFVGSALLAGLAGYGLQTLASADSWPVLVVEAAVVALIYLTAFLLVSFPLRQIFAATVIITAYARVLPLKRPGGAIGGGEGPAVAGDEL